MEKRIRSEAAAKQAAGKVKDVPRPESEPQTLTEREQEVARGGGAGVPGSPRERRYD